MWYIQFRLAIYISAFSFRISYGLIARVKYAPERISSGILLPSAHNNGAEKTSSNRKRIYVNRSLFRLWLWLSRKLSCCDRCTQCFSIALNRVDLMFTWIITLFFWINVSVLVRYCFTFESNNRYSEFLTLFQTIEIRSRDSLIHDRLDWVEFESTLLGPRATVSETHSVCIIYDPAVRQIRLYRRFRGPRTVAPVGFALYMRTTGGETDASPWRMRLLFLRS